MTIPRKRWVVALSTLTLTLGLAACGAPSKDASSYPKPLMPPALVQCADAAGLHGQSSQDKAASEQIFNRVDRTIAEGRSVVFASLATAAELKCSVQSAAADAKLAEATKLLNQAYALDSTSHWLDINHLFSQTDFLVLEAIKLLFQAKSAKA